MISFLTLCVCKYYTFSLQIACYQPSIVIPMTSHPPLACLPENFFFTFQQQFKHNLSPLGSLFNSALACFGCNFCPSSDLLGLIDFVGLSHLLSGEPFLCYCHNPNTAIFLPPARGGGEGGWALTCLQHTHLQKSVVPRPDPLCPLSFSCPDHSQSQLKHRAVRSGF